MADRTKIEWTRGDDGSPGATWNPTTGCTRVSPGCTNCYIETTPPFRIAGDKFRKYCPRCKGHGIVDASERACPECEGEGSWESHEIGATTGVNLWPARLDQPLRWRKPRRVFVNSLSDLFHEDVPDEYIARVFAVMALAGQHTFQVLTKRHGRMRALLNDPDFYRAVRGVLHETHGLDEVEAFGTERFPLLNVWLGVTVEDQQRADLRIHALLDTPAAVRFLSCEPLLGPVSLGDDTLAALDWVICGGESGKNARPMHPGWARSLRDECQSMGVPFFFKQWGDASLWQDRQGDVWTRGDDGLMHTPDTAPFPREHVERKWGPLKALGKKAAGRELDGRTWDEYPQNMRAS